MITILDLESLGLDPVNDPIIEIGMLAVTDDLQTEIASFSALVYTARGAARDCDPFVRQMHETSGLWSDFDAADPLLMGQVETQALAWLGEYATSEPPYLWGGSGVNHYDSGVLTSQMPRLRDALKYRADFDVSPVRGLATLAGVPEPDISDLLAHRALPDCRIALRQLQTYHAIFAASRDADDVTLAG